MKFWYLLEGNGFFRARLAARGSYCGSPSLGEGVIERDEPLSSSSRGDAGDDEDRRICNCNVRRQGRHIGHDGRMKNRPISANAMASTVMMCQPFTEEKRYQDLASWSVLSEFRLKLGLFHPARGGDSLPSYLHQRASRPILPPYSLG